MRTLALVALAVGCYHESKPPPKPSEPQPLVVEKPKHVRTAQDPLGFLPIDSEVVIHVDAIQVRRSAIWARFEPTIMAKAGPTLDQFRIACGFDPIPMIRRAALGMRNVDATHPDSVIVIRGIDRERTMRCLVQTIGRDPKTLAMEEGIVVIPPATPSDTALAMAFADASTLVFVTGPNATKDTMKKVLDSGAPLRNSPQFVDMFATIDTQLAAWFLVNGNAAFMKTLGTSTRGMFGSIDLSAGIGAKMRLRTNAQADAQSFVNLAQGQVGMAKTFVEKLELTADDTDVVIELLVTDDQATKILDLVGVP